VRDDCEVIRTERPRIVSLLAVDPHACRRELSQYDPTPYPSLVRRRD
jgi:hypothetical protein